MTKHLRLALVLVIISMFACREHSAPPPTEMWVRYFENEVKQHASSFSNEDWFAQRLKDRQILWWEISSKEWRAFWPNFRFFAVLTDEGNEVPFFSTIWAVSPEGHVWPLGPTLSVESFVSHEFRGSSWFDLQQITDFLAGANVVIQDEDDAIAFSDALDNLCLDLSSFSDDGKHSAEVIELTTPDFYPFPDEAPPRKDVRLLGDRWQVTNGVAGQVGGVLNPMATLVIIVNSDGKIVRLDRDEYYFGTVPPAAPPASSDPIS